MTKSLNLIGKFKFGFGALVAILVMLMAIAFTSFRQLADANRWNVQTYQVLVETYGISESLINMEVGARGFAVTGDESFLTRLTKARAEYSQRFNRAQSLILDERLAGWLRDLRIQQQQWTRTFIEPMVATRQNPRNAAATLENITRISMLGKPQVDAMRRTLTNINEREAVLLDQRSRRADSLQARTATVLIIGGLFAVMVAVMLSTQLVSTMRRLTGTNAQLAEEIAERKEAKAELQVTAQQLEAAHHANEKILEYSLDVICTIDEAGRFMQVSPACEKVWGYTPAELVGREYIALVHPDDVEKTNQAARDIVSGFAVTSFTNRYLRKDGLPAPMVWSAVWSEADKTMFCVARDDMERQQAEGAIRYAVRLAEQATEAAEKAQAEAQRAQAEAEKALAEAERANEAKSEFLSRTSHELRTPLNAILGFGQLLEMEELPDRQRAGVQQILKGGRHLLELVNEVLDIASIDAGRMALSSEPVHLDALVEEVLQLLQPLADERRIRFENCLGGGFVMADKQRLKQVILNLVSNAVKYNREGGLVRLANGTATIPGRVRFEVTDSGPGISPAGLEKVFSPFERLDADQSGVEGTGIGLTISQRLVRVMDGEIGVYSLENEGTTFWVELPGAQDPVQSLKHSEAILPMPKEAASNGASHTILYIEDNLSNLNLIEHILSRRAGVRLLSAMQGRRGLELAREHCPDLILLDLHLPDMNGDKVLQQLRAETATRNIPVVMLSADATPRQIERLLEAGASEYLTKPLDVKRFLQVIEQSLKEEHRH